MVLHQMFTFGGFLGMAAQNSNMAAKTPRWQPKIKKSSMQSLNLTILQPETCPISAIVSNSKSVAKFVQICVESGCVMLDVKVELFCYFL